MPTSTAWPILLAFGITLSFASLVTSVGVGIAGLVLVCCGVAGWAKQVLPEEHHEMIPVKARRFTPSSVKTQVAHIQVSEVHRAFLPVESYAVTSFTAISLSTVSGMRLICLEGLALHTGQTRQLLTSRPFIGMG